MCDTFVALGPATSDGSILFAKNSDREPNEAHLVVQVPRTGHVPGSKVRCTYIEIPQVDETYGVLLAKPFWIWGAEMGANEHGVVIGNEAVFTKTPYDKKPGLIGMDFLRLALERARTAPEARDVITELLARWGQGGQCGLRHKTYYHNSFLIADPREAWVLETAGREWAAVRARDIRSISNGLTIGSEYDLASAGLVETSRKQGWTKRGRTFDFARDYSDFVFTRFSRCRGRRRRTEDLLRAERGRIDAGMMMRVLRDHGPGAGPDWSPARGLAGFTVCAHAGFGPIRTTGTTGSMVSRLRPNEQAHFLTGTAAPCTSVFKPVWPGGRWAPEEPAPSATYDAAGLFWRHEALHRATLRNYPELSIIGVEERAALERSFIDRALSCTEAERNEMSALCFREAEAFEARTLAAIRAAAPRRYPGALYASAWKKYDRQAHFGG
ncbi:MAG: C69 family dipeptidase [Acidobacteriota bacterium]|nr:C69 family dipeptidase [Acidobacteriota bacterium]